MQNAVEHLIKELRNIRAGRATPAMLAGIQVDYYGSQTPLSQIANINTPDARTITVQPWEKNMLQEIEKAIMIANIGFNPMNNGENIIINVPPLTEERRIGLAKQAKAEAEHAKVGIRNARKDANNDIKKVDISDDLKKNSEPVEDSVAYDPNATAEVSSEEEVVDDDSNEETIDESDPERLDD